MARQRLTIGTFGEIGYLSGSSGRVFARARYRDWDGKNRLVQATADTRKQAERALKAKLADRTLFQPAASDLSPDSPFPDLVTYWLEDGREERTGDSSDLPHGNGSSFGG